MWLVVAKAFTNSKYAIYLQDLVTEHRFVMAYKRDMNRINNEPLRVEYVV